MSAAEGRAGVTTVVFDFGGVLLDWNPRHLYRKLFADPEEVEAFLAEIGFADWNLELDRGRPFADGVAELCVRHPRHRERIEAYHARWEETIAGPIGGTVEIVRELREAGVPLWGLSNWSAETFARVRHRFPFLEWLDGIVLSGEVRRVKPDPEIFRLLLRRAGRAAEECLFIDDNLPNVEAAAALGFRVHHFRSPEGLRTELERLGLLLGHGGGRSEPPRPGSSSGPGP